MTLDLRPYLHVRRLIYSADLLLVRAPGAWSSWAFARAGRGYWSHAAIAAWWTGTLMALETRAWVGGRAVKLSNLVALYPGLIDVYRCQMTWQERGATVERMKDLAGKPYGWSAVLAAAVRHSPLVRWCIPPETNDQTNGRLPMCSMAVAAAYREGAKIDPVPNLSDGWTEPSDLARSAIFSYLYTLEP